MLTQVQQLKLALFTNGMVITPEARRQIAGEPGRPLTFADYASTSSIFMELEGRISVNVRAWGRKSARAGRQTTCYVPPAALSMKPAGDAA